jgi:hypothetical protein
MPDLNTAAIVDAVASDAAASGLFESVNEHEPASSPGTGITAAVWVDRIFPVALMSGLASTSALLVLNVRLYTPMTAEPRDMVDVNLSNGVDALMAAYGAGFTLSGLVEEIDLLGAYGTPLSVQYGYIDIDTTMFRVATLTVPCVISDVWSQSP